MHMLVELHGQPGWVAALTPLSVDGMIVAASTALLADSRSGGPGGILPWALLAAGSMASLAAHVAVAEPTLTGRVIAAWPSFALIGAYEMLIRQVRRSAPARPGKRNESAVGATPLAGAVPVPGRDLQWQAWKWAQANCAGDGSLPSGREIARQFGRCERWDRLVKRSGCSGELAAAADTGIHLVEATAAIDR